MQISCLEQHATYVETVLQTVSMPIRHTFTHKKAPLPKITWTCGGGGGRGCSGGGT